MNELTRDRPKCLSMLGEKTLLQWQLDALNSGGIDDITVVVGYRKEKIEELVSNTITNERWNKTNMVSSMLCAGEWLSSGACLVTYGDVIYSARLVEMLRKASGQLLIPFNTEWYDLWKERIGNPLDDAETFKTDSNGDLTEIGRRPETIGEIQGQYMGIVVMTPEGFNSIKRYIKEMEPAVIDRMDMTTLLQNLVEAGVKVKTMPYPGQWLEVDTADDLAIYNRRYQHGDFDAWLG